MDGFEFPSDGNKVEVKGKMKRFFAEYGINFSGVSVEVFLTQAWENIEVIQEATCDSLLYFIPGAEKSSEINDCDKAAIEDEEVGLLRSNGQLKGKVPANEEVERLGLLDKGF